MRALALLLAFAAMGAAPAPEAPAAPAEFVLAVEFPYYLLPRTLWERELVWLKTIGVRTVEFSVPWNWHQLKPGEFDFNGRTSPRRDLAGFVRILRKLGLRAWVRPLPPVAGWLNGGLPAGVPAGGIAQRAWLKELESLLATQTVSHGGPVAYVEGRVLAIEAAAPPAPVTTISANHPAALAHSREALAGASSTVRGSLLWMDLEDAVYPAGWAATPATLLRTGAIGLSGEERVSTGALRRDAALFENWARLFAGLRGVPLPKQAAGKLPEGVRAVELMSPAASAVSVTNMGKRPFEGELRVTFPGNRRTLAIPGVAVPAGDSLWLPIGLSLGPDGLCRECSNFSAAEHIVYATAELLSVEYENGFLAMEFAAPRPGEVVLQLAREPVGPFLAAGKPTEFEWDEKALRARLPIPAGASAANRVRIGIAMEEPETSAFFNDARRLTIGRANAVSTVYSSAEVAARSRLRLPEGFTAERMAKSPNEIDYAVMVPPDAFHGDWARLTIEADGLPLGRARLQLFRPASIRLGQAMRLHFGEQAELAPDLPIAPVDPRGGANLDVLLRNNSTEIQTYHLEAAGEGLEFFPAKTDINVGALDERAISFRVFAREEDSGLHPWRLHVTGAAEGDMPMSALVLPRNRTVAWSADLDGDGSPEWVLESRKARAVFSSQDGGRWMEFVWKDADVNFLPEHGAFAAAEPVEVLVAGDALEFTGKGWKRTVRLADGTLTIEQTGPLPADGLAPGKRGNIGLSIERPSPWETVYTMK